MPEQQASKISLGYLIEAVRELKAGKARIHAGDVLRCIGSDSTVKTFINRRTRSVYALDIASLPENFRSIGFDGYETIVNS